MLLEDFEPVGLNAYRLADGDCKLLWFPRHKAYRFAIRCSESAFDSEGGHVLIRLDGHWGHLEFLAYRAFGEVRGKSFAFRGSIDRQVWPLEEDRV